MVTKYQIDKYLSPNSPMPNNASYNIRVSDVFG
jgi:hypothetical protein